MNEPRKPIFGFLWPKPDPQAPVDADYRQTRKVRIAARGPVRLTALMVTSVLLVCALGTTLMANLALGLTLPGILASAACATLLLLVLRGWVVGTYATDDLVVVETTWRRAMQPWSQIQETRVEVRPCPFLGLPIRTSARRVVLVTTGGRSIPTHLYSTSPDLWLRPEAFDAARIRLANWHEQR